MSGVLQNIDSPSPHRPACVYPPPSAFGAGGGHTRWVERGWGVSIVWKTPDTALYSIIRKYFVTYSPGSGSKCSQWESPKLPIQFHARFMRGTLRRDSIRHFLSNTFQIIKSNQNHLFPSTDTTHIL
jgi:hypothetical protein